MKAKYSTAIQIVLLMLAIAAGYILKGDLVGGPRLAHRIFGSLAALACIMTAIGLVGQAKRPTNVRALALAAASLSLLAGLAGKMAKTAANYSVVFNTMRASAGLALAASVALLVLLNDSKTPAKKSKAKSKK